MKVCDIKDCGKPYHGGGLCKSHYNAKWWSSTNPRKTNPWTKEVKALVAGMLLEKLSASQIAARLRPDVQVSRNAVVGVVHRDPILREIGLKGGAGAIPKAPRIKKSRIAGVLAAPRRRKFALTHLSPKEFLQHIGDHAPDMQDWCTHPPKLHKLPKPTQVAFECRSVPMVDLKPRECKWAVNDAAVGETHLFCGNASEPGRPYCPGHWPLSVGFGTRSEQMADRRNKPEFRRAA